MIRKEVKNNYRFSENSILSVRYSKSHEIDIKKQEIRTEIEVIEQKLNQLYHLKKRKEHLKVLLKHLENDKTCKMRDSGFSSSIVTRINEDSVIEEFEYNPRNSIHRISRIAKTPRGSNQQTNKIQSFTLRKSNMIESLDEEEIDVDDGENIRNRSSLASYAALNKSPHFVEVSLKPLHSQGDLVTNKTIYKPEEMLQVGQINDMVGSIRSLSMGGESETFPPSEHNSIDLDEFDEERSIYVTAVAEQDDEEEEEIPSIKREANMAKMYCSRPCINIPEAVDYRGNQSLEEPNIGCMSSIANICSCCLKTKSKIKKVSTSK